MAYPDSRVIFAADSSQVESQREIISLFPTSTWDRLSFLPVLVENVSRLKRAMFQVRYVFQGLARVAACGPHCLVLADLSNSLLLTLKVLLIVKRIQFPVILVGHTQFEPLAWNAPLLRKYYHTKPLWPPFPSNLKYVVLSDHIIKEVNNLFDRARYSVAAIDHPLLGLPLPRRRPVDGACRFGFIGTPSKGLDRFVELAREVRQLFPAAIFVYIGSWDSSEDRNDYASVLNILPNHVYSYREYIDLLASIDYAIWFSFENHYRFRVSGTIAELIVFGKPAVYLANDLVDEYFNRFGNIGYRCSSFDEVRERVLILANRIPLREYTLQCENLNKAGRYFQPAAIAPRLRGIIESVRCCPNSKRT